MNWNEFQAAGAGLATVLLASIPGWIVLDGLRAVLLGAAGSLGGYLAKLIIGIVVSRIKRKKHPKNTP